MVEFSLPPGSDPVEGKTFKAPSGAKNVKAFKIYRYDPDSGNNPQIDTFEVDLE